MEQDFQCRSCGAKRGSQIIDLGLQPLANNLLSQDDIDSEEPRFPLRVSVCEECWLLQITDLVPPVDLFSDYLYYSSFSDAMLQHAREASHRYIDEFVLNSKSLVVEIASNDGYMLKNFAEASVGCLGIEPAANVAGVAAKAGIETLVEFFGEKLALRLVKEGRCADLVLANNVFAHAPEINDFVAGISKILKPEGCAVLEFPYALDFIENTEFDTIYHEHVYYLGATPLLPLFESHGMDVFRMERIPIHGGSLRIFACPRGGRAKEASVEVILDQESAAGMNSLDYFKGFADRAEKIRTDLNGLLGELGAAGATVAAYGAAAKGATLLNYCQPPPGSIDFIADRSHFKQGRLSPGLHLPIVPAEELASRRPDYCLLLAWNFVDEIMAQQQSYRDAGGQFILPIPEVIIV
jgi:SAM-dependent methyltransferase